MSNKEENKFDYIKKLIDELSSNDHYIVLVFLLKCQNVEYGLKYLLGWYPFKGDITYDDDFLDRATLGAVIGKLEEINSVYLSDIIADAKEFLKIRNEVIHHFLTTDKTIGEIEVECAEKVEIANSLQRRISYLLEFADEVTYGFTAGHVI